MGAEPPSPWSRWDPPGVTYNPPLISQPFGDTGNGPFSQPFVQATGTPNFVVSNGVLIGQQDVPGNLDYVRCVYGDPNNQNVRQATEDCLRSIGCCTTTCCVDTSWEVKYAWAIALVIIFGIIVIIAVIIWFACWFFNRNRDKQQKKELLASTVPSPAQSQVSGAYPAYPTSVNNGYYPYVGGPSKYSGRF